MIYKQARVRVGEARTQNAAISDARLKSPAWIPWTLGCDERRTAGTRFVGSVPPRRSFGTQPREDVTRVFWDVLHAGIGHIDHEAAATSERNESVGGSE